MAAETRNTLSLSAKIVISLIIIFGVTFAQQWFVSELEDKGNRLSAIAINLTFPIPVFLLTCCFNKKYTHLNVFDIGFGFAGSLKNLVRGMLTAAFIIGSVLLIATFFGVTVVFTGLQKDGGLVLLEFIASNWVIGAWEEIYFRGFILNTMLSAKVRFHIGVFITAILFTVLHAGSYDITQTTSFWFIEVMLLSYILTYLYIINRSIWAPVAFHASWDFLWDLLDDSENVMGLIQVNRYREYSILLNNISIIILGIVLTIMIYGTRKKSKLYYEQIN